MLWVTCVPFFSILPNYRSIKYILISARVKHVTKQTAGSEVVTKPWEEEIDTKQQFVPLAQCGFKEGEFDEQPIECTFTPKPETPGVLLVPNMSISHICNKYLPFDHLSNTCLFLLST